MPHSVANADAAAPAAIDSMHGAAAAAAGSAPDRQKDNRVVLRMSSLSRFEGESAAYIVLPRSYRYRIIYIRGCSTYDRRRRHTKYKVNFFLLPIKLL